MEIPETDFMVSLLPSPHCTSAGIEGSTLLSLILTSARTAVPASGPIDYVLLFNATQQLVS